jgi:membrane associated rhomboid family serine protease
MLIPIGQENAVVRRDPWVAYAIILLNVLVAAPVFLLQPGRTEAIRDSARRFQEYVVEHPYLEVSGELRPLVPAEVLGQLAQIRARANELGRLPPAHELQREQRELDERGAALLRARAALPWVRWGFVPAEASLVTAFTSMWIHGGWLHLIGNLLFFFATGPFLEDAWGRPLFAGFYVVAGLVAVGTHAVYFAGSQVPLVGASGAIAGVMGAYLIRLGAARIRFWFLPLLVLPFFRVTLLLPAFAVLPFWFLGQHWLARQAAAGDGVAYWAHVGGFAFGLVVAGVLRVARVEQRFIHPAIERQVSLVQDAALERANEARFAGDWAAARRELRIALQKDPASLDAWREACEIALAAGDAKELERIAPRLLELYARAGEASLGERFVQETLRDHPPLASPRFLLAAAAFHDKTGDGRTALALYAAVGEDAADSEEAFLALVRSGEVLGRAGDAARARSLYAAARAHRACTGHWPARIDALLAALTA